MTADQLGAAFGVAKSTMSRKARQVRDLLRISHFSLEFQRADVAAQNPLAWIIDVNGLAVDARHVPPDIQAEAFQRGLIPYIPTLGPDETAARSRSQVTGTPTVASAATEVFPHAGGRLASPAEMPWPTPPRRPRQQACWIIAVSIRNIVPEPAARLGWYAGVL